MSALKTWLTPARPTLLAAEKAAKPAVGLLGLGLALDLPRTALDALQRTILGVDSLFLGLGECIACAPLEIARCVRGLTVELVDCAAQMLLLLLQTALDVFGRLVDFVVELVEVAFCFCGLVVFLN